MHSKPVWIAILALTLASACALYKPTRVLAPGAFGLNCPTATVCVEDIETLTQATALRHEAVAFVETNLGAFKKQPRVLFCSSTDCFRRFGNPQIRAQNVGTYGAVINVKGWDKYIVRHELIHHWQNENFGVLDASFRLPRWFIEGMAYVLSGEPRVPLKHAPSEAHRLQFTAWIAAGNHWRTPPD